MYLTDIDCKYRINRSGSNGIERMNWKKPRFLNRRQKAKPLDNSTETIESPKVYQSLFKQQLKALGDVLGHRTFNHMLNNPFNNKTTYLVLESPHANLTELSGHAIANITPRLKRGDVSIPESLGTTPDKPNTAEYQNNGYTLPSWYTEGSLLLMKVHYEDEVYT